MTLKPLKEKLNNEGFEITERGKRFFELILSGVKMKEAEKIVEEELPMGKENVN